ncbi:MAG: YbhN family protein [Granulosicoccus sp.]
MTTDMPMESHKRFSRLYGKLSPSAVKSCKVLFAAALLLLLALFVDVQEAVDQLKLTDWRWLVPACLLVQIQVVLSALRWKITANRLGQSLSTSRAISEYYLTTVANLSLPGGITGDAARVYRNRQPLALGVSMQSVVIERLAGQLALLIVSVIGWLLWPVLMQGGAPDVALRILSITLAVILILALTIVLIIRFAPDWITRSVVDYGPAFYIAWWSDRQWIAQSTISLAIVSTYLFIFLFSSYAVQAPLSIPAMMTLVPLVLLSMLIPLSIGGLGIREAAAAVLWPLAGLTSEAGIATSVVYAMISLFACLPGLVLLVWHSRVAPAK